MRLRRGQTLLFILLLCSWGVSALAGTSDPASWAQTTVSASLQLPDATGSPTSTPTQAEPLNISIIRDSPQASAPSPETVTHPGNESMATQQTDADGDDDGSLAAGDGAAVDEEELAPVDPETLEEVKVLVGEETTPPDDEGVTVPATEVHFDFPVVENQKVQYYIDYFTGPGRKVFTRWLERSTRYLPYMQDVFASHGLPRDLAYLSIVESGLNPKAYSWAHASGPWQFIYSTGKSFGLENDYWWDERRDFEKSTQAAALFLKELYTLFGGNWYVAVASYNAGAGTLQRAIERTGSDDFWVLAHSRYLPEETKNYIPQLLAVLLIAKQPDKYGFTDTAFLSPLPCDVVTVPAATDVEVIARLSGSSYEEIKALNPELKRWCTPPHVESYDVNLPLGTKDSFLAGYAELPPEQRLNYQVHKVDKGETLKGIAKKYRLNVDQLVQFNALAGLKSVRPGRHLVIPLHPDCAPIPVEDLRDDPAPVKIARSKQYKVRKGDTLTKISLRTGTSVSNLKAWNRLSNKSRLRIGQVLVVGAKGKGPTSVAATKKGKGNTSAKSAVRTTTAANSKVVYTVKAGDTVYKIARQYEVTPGNILSWNSLPKEHVLRPGQNLTLRVPGRKGG